MIQKTIWKPDTCGCVLEYEWDDSVSEGERTHTISNVIEACPAHSGISGDVGKYSAVKDENQRKNIVHGLIFENVASAVKEVVDHNGDVMKELKDGREYKWSFDKDRNLEIDLVNFTDVEKTQVEKIANTQFGTKVNFKQES